MPSPESAPSPALRARGPASRLWQAPVPAGAPAARCLCHNVATSRPAAGRLRPAGWKGLTLRLWRSLLVMVALAVGLAGCHAGPTPTPTLAPAATEPPARLSLAPPGPSTTTPAAEPSEPVRLILWHAWLGDRAEQALREATERFRQQHPLITVEPVCVGEEKDLAVKTVAAIQAGHPPDLAVADGDQVADLVQLDVAVDLEPYLGDPAIGLAEAERDDFFPGSWQSGIYPQFGSKMLSFPFAKSAVAMYYNATLLGRAGIKQAPRTWADLEAACKAVSKGDIIGLAWREDALAFSAFLHSRGARPLAGDPLKAAFNGPEGVESLDLLIRLGRVGAALRLDEGAARALFAQGKVAFAFGSTRDIAAYAEAIEKAGATFTWGVTMIPQADASAEPRTVLHGADLCILKTTEARPRAAWQFVKWFAGGEQAAKWASASGYLPARRSAVQSLANSGYLAGKPVVKEVYETVVPYAYPEPHARGEDEVRRSIENAWAAALAGSKTPNQALDEAAAKANEALGAKK